LGDNNPMKNPIHLATMKRNQLKVTQTAEHRKKCSDAHLIPDSLFQKVMKSKEYSKKLSKALQNCEYNTSGKHSHDARMWGIKRSEANGGKWHPSFNKSACKIIDEYGKNHDYNFQHALNGGEYHIEELGY